MPGVAHTLRQVRRAAPSGPMEQLALKPPREASPAGQEQGKAEALLCAVRRKHRP